MEFQSEVELLVVEREVEFLVVMEFVVLLVWVREVVLVEESGPFLVQCFGLFER